LQRNSPEADAVTVDDLTLLLNRIGSESITAEELLPLVYQKP
jgi:hypothetical protein